MSKEYYEKNKVVILEKSRIKYKENTHKYLVKVWGNHLRKYFIGATAIEAQEIYEKMLSDQNGVCKICKLPEVKVDSQNKKVCRLAVDHCKDTGHVRGLLCFMCNTTLGRYERNLDSIVTYLRDSKINFMRKKLNSG